jgi:hypothetical protein
MQKDSRREREDDIDVQDKKGGRPGPVDKGRDGGMATREVTPDVAEPTEEPPD